MLVSIEVENFRGIRSKVEADFFAKSRKLENNKFIQFASDNKTINKLIGISGANGAGKTSFLEAIQFIQFWIYKSMFLTKTGKFEDASDIIKDIRANKMLLDVMNDSSKITSLKYVFYFDSIGKMLNGYYEYNLNYKYQDNKITVIREKLEFFHKYNSERKSLVNVANVENSDIGYNLAFYENIKSQCGRNATKIRRLDRIKGFAESIMDMIVCGECDERELSRTIRKHVKNDKEWLLSTISLIDPKIIDIYSFEEDGIKKMIFKNVFGKELQIADLSSGTKKILYYMLVVREIKRLDNTIIIDEIETSINPSLVKLLISIMPIQLIFTTQYPEIFDFKDIEKKNEKIFRTDQVYYIDIQNNINVLNNLTGTRTDSKYSDIFKKEELEFFPKSDVIKEYRDKQYKN